MKRMHQFVKLSIVILVLFQSIHAWASANWGTDYKKALEKAKAEKKMVFMNFTRSDWCPFCIKLDKEILSQPEFEKFADARLVLLKIDFPRRTPLPPQFKKQNDDLAMQYKIEEFPALIILNSDGKTVGRLGYMEGGPSAMIAALNKFRK